MAPITLGNGGLWELSPQPPPSAIFSLQICEKEKKSKKKKKHRSDSKRKTHMCTRTPTCSKAVFLSTSGLQEEASWIDWEIMKEGRERGIDAAGPCWQEQTTPGWVRHLHTRPGRIQNPSRSGCGFCFHMLSLNKYLLIISLAADIHPAVVTFFKF